MAKVVLINPCEVPKGKDEAFLAGWEAAKAFMEGQKGYVSTRLHRSFDPKARFRFIKVAEWESAEDFQTALNHPDSPCESHPIGKPLSPTFWDPMPTVRLSNASFTSAGDSVTMTRGEDSVERRCISST